MPFHSVNQRRLEAAYAVPTPSLEPGDHRGAVPGCPNAVRLPRTRTTEWLCIGPIWLGSLFKMPPTRVR